LPVYDLDDYYLTSYILNVKEIDMVKPRRDNTKSYKIRNGEVIFTD